MARCIRLNNSEHTPPRDYRPAWWLPGANLQTLWAARIGHAPSVAAVRERLELPDGDFVDLAWRGDPRTAVPLILLLHGLEGGLASPYVRRLLHAVAERGWTGCLLQFRGCSGEPNRLPRSYHSGDTADFAFLVETLSRRYPGRPIIACGYSLGGNVLLKYLGEQGRACRLAAGVAVSVPFDLAAAAARLNRGFSRVYQAHLLASMQQKLRRKFAQRDSPIDLGKLADWNTFRLYDEQVTAPLHGFSSAADYYARASSGGYLPMITTPTLILHASDDPFLPAAAIPRPPALAPSIQLELARRGGHVGFVAATGGWLEQRLILFMTDIFAKLSPQAG